MFIVAKQAEGVLNGFDEIDKFQIIVGRKAERDEMALRIELKDSMINKSLLLNRINQKFKDACRLSLDDIIFVSAGTIPDDRKTINDTRKWE